MAKKKHEKSCRSKKDDEEVCRKEVCQDDRGEAHHQSRRRPSGLDVGMSWRVTPHRRLRHQMKRAERANALGVNLFLSIHHDDVQNFYHAKWTYNGTAHLFSERFSGYSLFVSRENRHYEDSLVFAKLLGAALMGHGMRYSPHHAEAIPGEGRQLLDRQVGIYLYDQLVVLKSTEAPAVLLEAGIIVNRVEELVLSSPEGRVSISAAVLEAVNQFCSQQQRP
jgi:N-acetylmuramoyl-L-alanine amidase